MIKNYVSIVFLAFVSAMSITHLSAQDKVEKYKVVVLEKSTDENGNEVEKKIVKEGDEAKKFIDEMNQGENTWLTDDGEEINLEGKEYKMIEKRAYKMIVEDEHGNEKTIEWDGEGEMPKEIKEALEKEGLLPHEDFGLKSDVEDISVNVEVDANGNEKRTVKIVTAKDGKNEVMEFEMEGDEIPEDMQKMLEDKGIDLRLNVTDEPEEKETKDVEVNVAVDATGMKTQKIKIISDKNGEKEVVELEVEGDEIPEEVQKILDEHNIDLNIEDDGDTKKVIKVIKEEDDSSNKPQLGVLIENADTGVKITDVLPETSADIAGLKKGDIVTAVNGNETKVIKDLQQAIKGAAVGDVIKVDYLRNGQAASKEVTLKKTVKQFEFETWDEVMKSGKKSKTIQKEISIEKEVIIKKN